MEIKVSSKTLGLHLGNLVKVINTKSATPILGSFLFEVRDGKLYVTASDSENTMCDNVEIINSDGNFCFCVKAHSILDAVKELPEQPITISYNGKSSVKIEYSNGVYKLGGEGSEEYPRMQALGESNSIEMDSGVLRGIIGRSMFAVSQDELRPVLSGLYIEAASDDISAVASNGRELVRTIVYGPKSDVPFSFILPQKPAQIIGGILGRYNGNVIISVDNKVIEVRMGDCTLKARLVEGRYPNYRSVIPASSDKTITIDRMALLGAMKRTMSFASGATMLARFDFADGKVAVCSEDIDFAVSAKETVPCEYYGAPISIGFKGTAVSEILKALSSDTVTISLTEASRPGVFRPVGDNGNMDVIMLVMPMLLQY